MRVGTRFRARALRGFQVAGVVVAITIASSLGLHDWADRAATHTAAGSAGDHSSVG